MQSIPLKIDVTVTTFLRFQRWRRRQQLLWPGLFSDFLTTIKSSKKSETSHSITLQSFRNVEYQLLIDDTPTVLCDGCGALQQLHSSHGSSDPTLPPSKEETASLFLTCSACGFPTPLGHFRTLLSLAQCGPHLCPSLALAIFVEATGSQFSLSNTNSNLHAWIRDRKCRLHGLQLLLGAIGVREEQLCPPQLSACNNDEESPISVMEKTKFHNAQRAERYLEAKLSPRALPKLPFSASNLCQASPIREEGVEAAEQATQILNEANRIWKECRAHQHHKHRIFKLNNLAREFHAAQTRARIFNHANMLPFPTSHDTQVQPTP
ncbi:hypothetical protein FGB62_22g28 [Gracilaria domingensis]|nr:hypothetical protein FGB62_22g28 [Gracilaria domingensis]